MAKRLLIFAFALAFLPIALPLGFAVSAQDQKVSDGQKLALLTKPSVVRIYDGYLGTFVLPNQTQIPTQYVGSGSGSIINPDGYIMTNAHVTDLTHQGDEAGKQALIQQLAQIVAQKYNVDINRLVNSSEWQQILSQTQLTNFQHIHHVVLPNGSAYPYEIKEFGAPIGQGKDVSIIKIEIKNAPTLKIGDSDKVQLQDHVTVVGYPGAADTFDTGTLDAKSALEASITDGKLSAKKNAADGAPILQISAPATHGNSGGPVLSDAGEVIGMLTFRGDTVNGQEVSGFAFVVPTSTAMEFVKKAGTTNTPSLTNQRYEEGLQLYWDGYYTKAIAKFEEVKRLFPQHSEVDRLITDSQQKISEGKEKTNALPIVIAIAVLVVFVFIVIVIVAFILLRRKKGPAPMQQPAFAGGPSFASQPPMGMPGGGFQPQQPMFQQPTPMPQIPQGSMPPQQMPGPAAPMPAMGPGPDSSKTMVVSAVQAPQAGFGAIVAVSGPLTGQQFEIRPEGVYIGRDGTLAQVVINDGRVSKRHVWVGPRNGRVAVVDQGSTNGTFLNQPGSQRITEVFLNPGDVIILSEADVARFRYQK